MTILCCHVSCCQILNEFASRYHNQTSLHDRLKTAAMRMERENLNLIVSSIPVFDASTPHYCRRLATVYSGPTPLLRTHRRKKQNAGSNSEQFIAGYTKGKACLSIITQVDTPVSDAGESGGGSTSLSCGGSAGVPITGGSKTESGGARGCGSPSKPLLKASMHCGEVPPERISNAESTSTVQHHPPTSSSTGMSPCSDIMASLHEVPEASTANSVEQSPRVSEEEYSDDFESDTDDSTSEKEYESDSDDISSISSDSPEFNPKAALSSSGPLAQIMLLSDSSNEEVITDTNSNSPCSKTRKSVINSDGMHATKRDGTNAEEKRELDVSKCKFLE